MDFGCDTNCYYGAICDNKNIQIGFFRQFWNGSGREAASVRGKAILYDIRLKIAVVGGHTHTIVIDRGPDAGTPVDTGFIVLNDRTPLCPHPSRVAKPFPGADPCS